MAYEKLLGQGMRCMWICPSDWCEVPNPSDQITWERVKNYVEPGYACVASGTSGVVELGGAQPTWRDMKVTGGGVQKGDIIYFYDTASSFRASSLQGAGVVRLPQYGANDRQAYVDIEPSFAALGLDPGAVDYDIKVFRRPKDFPMVTLPAAITNLETTFISAGGDGLEMIPTGGVTLPSCYGSPGNMQVISSRFPVQIRRILNSTVDKTGAATTVSSNTGWQTYYLGIW